MCYALGVDLGSDFERNLARRGVWSVLEVRIFDTQKQRWKSRKLQKVQELSIKSIDFLNDVC